MKFFTKPPSKSSENLFQTKHLQSDLKGHALRGGAATVASTISRFAIRLSTNLVLARLLTPEDYGLFGMVTVVTNFVDLFKRLGISDATIQKSEINHRQSSTLFWISTGLGLCGCLLVAALSPLVASFYDEPRLLGITLALAPSFLISSLGSQHSALLRRQMRFSIIAKIEVISFSLAILLAVILALNNFGYWSLILMQVAEVIITTVALWSVCSWRPGLPHWESGIQSMLVFGGNLTGFRVLAYFTRSLDYILIGRFWGARELGLYTKAYQLLWLPIQQFNNPITNVALPALSSLQEQPEKYRAFYKNAILSITFLGMPVVAFCFASSNELILLVLGENWVGAAPLFRLLMPAAFVGTFNSATEWVYQSLGRTDRQVRWGIVTSIVISLVFTIVIPWGSAGIALGLGIIQPILATCGVIYCYRGTFLKPQDLLSALSMPAITSLGAMFILIAIRQAYIAHLNLILIISLDMLLYGLFYFGIWLAIPNGKLTLIKILKSMKDIKSKKK